MSNATELKTKFTDLLKAMFQLDQPELDFGLYRIMHARKDDINCFIEQDLPKKISEAFAGFQGMDRQQVAQELEKAKKAAVDAGFDPSQSPKVKALEAQFNAQVDLSREEGDVYDALVTFFGRYYDEGDFISRRIYKDGTYAIPYNGEEVVLHWANKDQYYIKSSVNLRDYTFRLNPHDENNPMRLHFKLVDAEAGASNNNKETEGKSRVFILRKADQDHPTWAEIPVKHGEHECTELEIYFEYRVATDYDWTETAKNAATDAAKKKPPTQDHLRQIAVECLLQDTSLPVHWKTPLSQAYTKANGEKADYSNLQGQINNYTKANKFDYFIHKDLGKFLRQELDFYIKNELLRWEDIAANKANFAKLGPMFSKIEVIRQLGEAIITFLAQLEDFQKKLWLKKKFVTETQYCITLDRLEHKPGLLESALNNQAQCDEWVELFKIDLNDFEQVKSQGVEAVLAHQNYRYLVIDTGVKTKSGELAYSENFKAKLVASIEDLDEQVNGLLIHSENFQALNLIQARFKEQVKCIYIDPPYNTEADRAQGKFLYKDGFSHSSWLSMIYDRVTISKLLLGDDGVFISSIDDTENATLKNLYDNIFDNNLLANCIWVSGRTSSAHFTNSHEYVLTYAKDKSSLPFFKFSGYSDSISDRTIKRPGQKNPASIISFPAGIEFDSDDRIFPSKFGDKEPVEVIEGCLEAKNKKLAQSVKLKAGWTMKNLIERWLSGEENITDSKGQLIKRFYFKTNGVLHYEKERGTIHPNSVITDITTKRGSIELSSLFEGAELFDFPKPTSLVNYFFKPISSKSDIVLDYFSGSGTTGHAVINLNRDDQGIRKYILIEMGDYFDTVTKPRIQKVIYSKDWNDGEPKANEKGCLNGVSQCFKYMRLESYEDTLGNLALNRPNQIQSDLFDSRNPEITSARSDYLMNYMLEVETRGSDSLLNIAQFNDPMAYQLKVRSASGDETKFVNVDLIETFNWLLGLTVSQITAPVYFGAEFSQTDLGKWQAQVTRYKGLPEGLSDNKQAWWFRTVDGYNRQGQRIVIVWRNLPKTAADEDNGLVLDNAVLQAIMLDKLDIRLTESPDDDIDIVYVNGDHNIIVPKRKNGELLETRVQSIEETFHRLMFQTNEGLI
jgi:adenine-specific DNA-methyltransferase